MVFESDYKVKAVEGQYVSGLGRTIIEHDPRSREYPIREMLAPLPGLEDRVWYRRGVFDQGTTSSCVGQSVAGLVLSSPNRQKLGRSDLVHRSTVDPYPLYQLAQELDPWEGKEPDYYGTSTLAGLKAAKQLRLLREYRWCFGVDDVLRTLSSFGPVVVGVNWYSSFDKPGRDGRIDIDPYAFIRGGHAVELTSINVDERTVRGVNSWGKAWGDSGRFEWTWKTLERLLEEEGEAATAIL